MSKGSKAKGSLGEIFTRNFVILATINLAMFFGFQMTNVGIPVYMAQLGAGTQVVGLAATFMTITATIVRIFSGAMLDRFGRAGMLIGGTVVMLCSLVSYAVFPIVGVIIGLRLVQGVGWGAGSTASSTIAADIIPKRRFAEGMGYFAMTNALSSALAPAVAVELASGAGGAVMVYVAAGITAIALVLSIVQVLLARKDAKASGGAREGGAHNSGEGRGSDEARDSGEVHEGGAGVSGEACEEKGREGESERSVGYEAATAQNGPAPAAVSAAAPGPASCNGPAPAAAPGSAPGPALAAAPSSAPGPAPAPGPAAPSSKLSMLFERRAVVPGALMLLVNIGFGCITTFIALHALEQGVQNVSPYFVVYAIVTLVSRPFIGRFIDYYGYRVPAILSTLCTAASLVLIGASNSILMFAGAGVLGGLGIGTAMSTYQAMAVANVEPWRRGVATSTYMTAFDLGIAIGSFAGGLIGEAFGFQVMYYAVAAFPLAACALSLVAVKKRPRA